MNKYFKTFLFGLPLVCLAACSDDAPVAGDPTTDSDVAENTDKRYLRVTLVNAGTQSGGRAIGDSDSDYANGTEDENKIRTVDFYFYDADKEYHSHVSMNIDDPTDPNTSNVTESWVHGFYEANVPISITQGEKMPTYVLCVINAIEPSMHIGSSLGDSQKRILSRIYSPEIGSNGERYFAMNNSVYYGRDEVTGLDNQLIMATPFDSNKLYTESELKTMSEEDLQEATINIYVERYAAKVNLSITGEATTITSSNTNPVDLDFEPTGWGLNAYETNFFFIKSYRSDTGIDSDYSTYDELNNVLFSGWNRPDHYRSYWSRTPGYYDNNYPVVADDVLDNGADSYTVQYSSYNTAIQNVDSKGALASSIYTSESTLKETRLTGKDENLGDQYLPLTSIPSVVVVGKYKVNGKSNVTFYTYQTSSDGNPYVYSENEGEIDGVSTILNRLLRTQTIVMVPSENGKDYDPVRIEDLGETNPFVVKHPEKESREGLRLGGDLVTLQIKDANSGFVFYDTDTHSYVDIDNSEAIAKVNRLLYQNLGAAHQYTNGMAFFSAPIQHWGWQRTGNPNAGLAMDKWDWNEMKVGDFGIVRNHIYTLQISKISGLGTGIISADDPLLPPTDKVSYAVHFHVNIQKWATLPTQTWEW